MDADVHLETIAKTIDLFSYKLKCKRLFYGHNNGIRLQACFILFNH